jgi:hypothetical protein
MVRLLLIFTRGLVSSGDDNIQRHLVSKLTALDILSRLPFADDAPFNSYKKQHEPICLPNTRVDILEKINKWIYNKDKQCLFWLNGLAGTGKSTIARTIARQSYEKRHLGASFFFSRGGGDVGTAEKFVTSIARQLISHSSFCRNIFANLSTSTKTLPINLYVINGTS